MCVCECVDTNNNINISCDGYENLKHKHIIYTFLE